MLAPLMSITLWPGVGSYRDDVAEATAALAGAVRARLQSAESARRVASVCDRLVERQPAQVDGSHVGAPQRSRHLSSLSAFHHARAVGRRGRLDTTARPHPRAHRGVDSRRRVFPNRGWRLWGWPASTAGRAARWPIVRPPSPSPCGRGHAPGCWARRCICPRNGSHRVSGREDKYLPRLQFAPKYGNWRRRCCARCVRPGSPSPPWPAMPSSATTPRCAACCIAPNCRTRWGCRPISRCSWGRPRSSRRRRWRAKDGRAPAGMRFSLRTPSGRGCGRRPKRRASGDSSRGAMARIVPGARVSVPSA